MGIYNSKNTLFAYDAFWSLYLPFSVSPWQSDVIRSYWGQRLMRLIDGTVTFRGPNSHRLLNKSQPLHRPDKEMVDVAESLITFLFDWKCSMAKFYECVVNLSEAMAAAKFWSHEEVDSIKRWLGDLNSLDYVEPDMSRVGKAKFG